MARRRSDLHGAGARALGAALVSAALLSAAAAPADGQGSGEALVLDPAKLPEVVARVNGLEITRRELVTQAELARAQMGGLEGASAEQAAAFYRDVLEGLIGELLIYHHARERGLAATDAEVEEAIAAMRSSYADQEAFEQALAEQGASLEDVRRQIRQSMSIEKVLYGEIGSAVTVGEPAKRAFYETHSDRLRLPERRRARHLLIAVPESASAEERAAGRARAAELLERLRAGESFSELAAAHSDDTGSKDQGGELPWLMRAGRRPDFESVVFAMSAGELSDVVETSAGFHVVELLEVQPGRQRPFSEVEKQIEEHLKNAEIQRRVQQRVRDLRAAAEIEILIGG